MDLAYTVRRAFPGPGGISRMMQVTASELSARHRVRVWASRIDAEPFTRLNTTLTPQRFAPLVSHGVEVRPIPEARAAAAPLALTATPVLRRVAYGALRRATAPAYVAAVARHLAREWADADVVHAWGGEHVNWAAGRAARGAGLPLVVTPFAHPGAWGDDEMNASFYRSADAVLALLPTEARFYEGLGVEESRIHVVGVPVTPLPETGPDVRSRHALGDDPVVVFLGVKEPYKGYRLLLEAARSVWRARPKARFAFVGPRTAASRSDFAGIDDARIVEVDMVPDDEVASWLRAATVLCLPSTSEIMPVSIVEAWHARTPVVAAEWWCARDLIDHDRDGLIVRPTAEDVSGALVGVLGDPEGARRMGEAGREKTLRYLPAAVSRAHEVAYEAVWRP